MVSRNGGCITPYRWFRKSQSPERMCRYVKNVCPQRTPAQSFMHLPHTCYSHIRVICSTRKENGWEWEWKDRPQWKSTTSFEVPFLTFWWLGAVTGWVTIVGTQWGRNSRGAQASNPSLKGPQIEPSSKSRWDRHIQCQMHAVEVSRCSSDSMHPSIVIESNFLQCFNSTNDRTASTAFLKMFVEKLHTDVTLGTTEG